MTAEEQEKLDQIKLSHSWMLDVLKTQHDQLYSEGNYSPELQHSINCGEILETM